jgi:hypothetical protein
LLAVAAASDIENSLYVYFRCVAFIHGEDL